MKVYRFCRSNDQTIGLFLGLVGERNTIVLLACKGGMPPYQWLTKTFFNFFIFTSGLNLRPRGRKGVHIVFEASTFCAAYCHDCPNS